MEDCEEAPGILGHVVGQFWARQLALGEVERLLTERVVRSGSEKAPVFMSSGCFEHVWA